MFTNNLPYLDAKDFALYLLGRRGLGRWYVSLDTLMEGLATARRSVDLSEGDMLKRLKVMLYSQRCVFEDPMIPHRLLQAVKDGASFDTATAEGNARYLGKRGFQTS